MFLINLLVQETTPLAGSSAGAIICAVIASGSSMQEALQVTKKLAEDCRLKGTAFRLGVCNYSSIEGWLTSFGLLLLLYIYKRICSNKMDINEFSV